MLKEKYDPLKYDARSKKMHKLQFFTYKFSLNHTLCRSMDHVLLFYEFRRKYDPFKYARSKKMLKIEFFG